MYAPGGELTWNMVLLTVLLAASVVYTLLIHLFEKTKWHDREPILFYSGLVILFFIAGTPLTQLSHVSFTSHMVQMSILYFLVPPLLLLGIPSKWFIQNTGRLPPLIALITFSALFLLYHLPFFIHFLFGRPDIHVIFKLGLFVFALLMWQPIANNKLKSAEKAKRYALLSGILLMPACLLFIVNGIINTEDGLGPFQTYRSLQLCISPEQMELIFPYQLKYDEIIGGITMLGLHKGSIVLTFKLGKIVKKDKETRKAK